MSRARRVVVIGGGISGLSAAWTLASHGAEVVLLERDRRLGGLVESERTGDGLLLEHGPDAFAIGGGALGAMLSELGLDRTLVRSGRAPRRALVRGRDELAAVPEELLGLAPRSSLALMRSSFLGVGARMRAALEPFVPKASESDESVEAFFHRRFGPGLAEQLALPMMRGIHGASGPQLSMATALPELHRLEQTYGSVAAGMARRLASPGAPSRGLASLEGGMEALPRALAEALGARARLGCEVEKIELRSPGVRVTMRGDETLDADAVVIALPAHAAARLLMPTDPHLAHELAAIPYRDVAMVTLAFDRADVPDLPRATGVVVAKGAGLRTTAVTLASEKWLGRAPEDRVVLRAAVDASADPDTLIAAVRSDLHDLFGIDAQPTLVRVRRLRQALPVPLPGHRTRVDRIERWARALGPIALAGNAYRGAGVPECIASGVRAGIALA